MHEVNIGKRKLLVPARFNELSRHQLLAIAKVMFSRQRVGAQIAAYVLILLHVKTDIRIAFEWLFRIGSDTKIDFALLTEFLFEKPLLTVNKITKVKINHFWKKSMMLYGPPDRLTRICMLEFIRADKYCREYHQALKEDKAEKAIESLNGLMAVLYRPGPSLKSELPKDDNRKLYDDDQVSYLTQLTSKLPMNVKQAVYLFYVSCRVEMIKPFKYLFPQEEKQITDDSQPNSTNWVPAMYSIAESALRMEEVGRTDARLIMYDLDQRIKRQKESEK